MTTDNMPALCVNDDGLFCMVIGGATIPLDDLEHMENIASARSVGGKPHKVLLRATYVGGQKRHFVVRLPACVPFAFHRTISSFSDAGWPYTVISAEIIPTLSDAEFDATSARLNADTH